MQVLMKELLLKLDRDGFCYATLTAIDRRIDDWQVGNPDADPVDRVVSFGIGCVCAAIAARLDDETPTAFHNQWERIVQAPLCKAIQSLETTAADKKLLALDQLIIAYQKGRKFPKPDSQP